MTANLILKMLNSYKGLSILVVGGFIFASPAKTDKVIVRNFSRGLNIQTSKREPPRIAFAEILDAAGAHSPQIPAVPSVNLNEKVEQKFAEKTVTLLRAKKIRLKEFTIARDELLQEIESRSWVETLPPEQKRRMIVAQQASGVLDSDWSLPTWRDELKSQLVTIKQQLAAQPTPAVGVQVFSPSGQGPPSKHATSDVGVNEQSKSLVEPNSGKWIDGTVLLQNGLGLGDGYIDIRYFRNGIAQGRGTVQLPNKFRIQVPERAGTLVANLYSRQGEKLGEGELRVAHIIDDQAGSARIVIGRPKTTVAVQPRDFDRMVAGTGKRRDYGDRGLMARTYFASLDTEVKPDEAGVAKVENVAKESWTLARTEAPGYAPALNLIRAGEERQRPLFRNQFIKALLDISREQQMQSLAPETNSVVWGQAKFDGKARAGVKVEVEFGEEYRTVYFNTLMIPDSSLKATSENGYFAILHLPEGLHSLIATSSEQYFSHVNVQIEPGVTSFVELDALLKTETTEMKVFDAFAGDARAAQVEMQSLAEPLHIDGFAEIFLPQIERLSFMKVSPLDAQYLPSMQVYTDSDDSIRVPLVRADWIQFLRQQRKISDVPETSFVVGFVQDDNFDVFLPHDENYASTNIVYFDPQGRITEQGVAGGGYVLFNVIQGTHSVVTVSKTTNTAHCQVIPVDPNLPVILK